MLEPHQRGGTEGSDVANAEVCNINQESAPCGSGSLSYRGEPQRSYAVKTHLSFVLQVNKEHYVEENPGSFKVYMWPSSSFGQDPAYSTALWEMEDNGGQDLRELKGMFDVPSYVPGNYTLQAIYFTNRNESHYPHQNYFACSDILLLEDDMEYLIVVTCSIIFLIFCICLFDRRQRRRKQKLLRKSETLVGTEVIEALLVYFFHN
jgi:hypothetical protein